MAKNYQKIEEDMKPKEIEPKLSFFKTSKINHVWPYCIESNLKELEHNFQQRYNA